ncbi:TMEM43 family protein [Thalassobaculum sp.]|uniref:TMEM43 family protein n=1 Tax=Thalassobaculum sp. TaxID=2022740 RepID=UPI0032ED80F7
MDEFREVIRKSWGERLGGAFVGVVIGLLMFVLSFPVLWWNEGRSVDRARTLAEGLELVIPVAADPVDPAHDKGLIHISDRAVGDGPLDDPAFGLSVDALKVKRVVEMYQWIEEKEERTVKEAGGSERTETTYRYHREWSDRAVDSARFRIAEGHRNPAALPFAPLALVAPRISIGAFALTRDFVSQIDDYRELPVSDAVYAGAPENVRGRFQLSAGRFHQGDPAAPQIGDVRVGFLAIHPQEIGVVGRQSGNRIEPYRTRTGEIALLRMGGGSADSLFADARDENTLITWGIRLGGFAAMWIGLALLFGPIKILADVLPVLGTIVGAGFAMVAGLAAVALSAVTIGLAWLAYRPLIGIGLLAVAAAAMLASAYLARRKRQLAGPA